MTILRMPSRPVGVLLAILALVTVAGCSGGGPQDSGAGYVTGSGDLTQIPPADRQPAPVLTGPQLGTDRQLSSASYQGKVLVFNVWASWCGPCRAEAKGLQAASTQTRKDAQFLGINSRDPDPAPAQAFVRVQGITYPSFYDPNGEQLLKFTSLPPNSIPSTVVIDQQGRIAARAFGTVSETTLIDLVNDVAAGK